MRKQNLVIAAAGAAFAAVMAACPALAENWTVTRVSGQAWVRTGPAPQQRITLGMSIPASASIGTSADGRVMLERGQGRIFVSPQTTVVVTDPDPAHTRVVQSRGTLELEVEKRSAPYFSVETPLLAALVKGTHFTTTVSPGRNAVHVDHGVVQVRELRSGRTADVTRGQSAASTAGAASGFAVSGAGQMPEIRQEAPRASLTKSSPPVAATNSAIANTSHTLSNDRAGSGQGSASALSTIGSGGTAGADAKGSGNGGATALVGVSSNGAGPAQPAGTDSKTAATAASAGGNGGAGTSAATGTSASGTTTSASGGESKSAKGGETSENKGNGGSGSHGQGGGRSSGTGNAGFGGTGNLGGASGASGLHGNASSPFGGNGRGASENGRKGNAGEEASKK